MNNNILLKYKNIIFEPHILENKDLPFIYHHDVIYNEAIANLHENLELLFFTYGNGFVRYNTTSYPVQKGDVIVVNSYTIHQVIPNGRIDFFCLIIDNHFCKYNNIDTLKINFTPLIQDVHLNKCLQNVINECEMHKKFEYTGIKCAVLDLLLFLCRNYSSLQTEPFIIRTSSFECICRGIDYIKNNLNQKLKLDDVAASVGLSKYYFLREFKKITGCTFSSYINLIRCEYAKVLLSNNQYTIKEVAILCGFDNYSYFTNVFKKYTKMLPSEFKNPPTNLL